MAIDAATNDTGLPNTPHSKPRFIQIDQMLIEQTKIDAQPPHQTVSRHTISDYLTGQDDIEHIR